MKITDFLSKDCIKVDLKSKTKKEALEELADILVAAGKVTDKAKVMQVLLEREELGSTGATSGSECCFPRDLRLAACAPFGLAGHRR